MTLYLFDCYLDYVFVFSIIEQDSDAYLICNEKKRLETKHCPTASIFQEGSGCQDPTKVTFRQSAVTGTYA